MKYVHNRFSCFKLLSRQHFDHVEVLHYTFIYLEHFTLYIFFNKNAAHWSNYTKCYESSQPTNRILFLQSWEDGSSLLPLHWLTARVCCSWLQQRRSRQCKHSSITSRTPILSLLQPELFLLWLLHLDPKGTKSYKSLKTAWYRDGVVRHYNTFQQTYNDNFTMHLQSITLIILSHK